MSSLPAKQCATNQTGTVKWYNSQSRMNIIIYKVLKRYRLSSESEFDQPQVDLDVGLKLKTQRTAGFSHQFHLPSRFRHVRAIANYSHLSHPQSGWSPSATPSSSKPDLCRPCLSAMTTARRARNRRPTGLLAKAMRCGTER